MSPELLAGCFSDDRESATKVPGGLNPLGFLCFLLCSAAGHCACRWPAGAVRHVAIDIHASSHLLCWVHTRVSCELVVPVTGGVARDQQGTGANSPFSSSARAASLTLPPSRLHKSYEWRQTDNDAFSPASAWSYMTYAARGVPSYVAHVLHADRPAYLFCTSRQFRPCNPSKPNCPKPLIRLFDAGSKEPSKTN
jgi:hypothetical protein